MTHLGRGGFGHLSLNCFAVSTICKVEDSFHIEVIAWDSETRVAKFTDFSDTTFVGEVTLEREHGEGYKINMFFKFEEPYFGDDAVEFILFWVASGHRVLRVSYVERDGKMYLNTGGNAESASCASI